MWFCLEKVLTACVHCIKTRSVLLECTFLRERRILEAVPVVRAQCDVTFGGKASSFKFLMPCARMDEDSCSRQHAARVNSRRDGPGTHQRLVFPYRFMSRWPEFFSIYEADDLEGSSETASPVPTLLLCVTGVLLGFSSFPNWDVAASSCIVLPQPPAD